MGGSSVSPGLSFSRKLVFPIVAHSIYCPCLSSGHSERSPSHSREPLKPACPAGEDTCAIDLSVRGVVANAARPSARDAHRPSPTRDVLGLFDGDRVPAPRGAWRPGGQPALAPPSSELPRTSRRRPLSAPTYRRGSQEDVSGRTLPQLEDALRQWLVKVRGRSASGSSSQGERSLCRWLVKVGDRVVRLRPLHRFCDGVPLLALAAIPSQRGRRP